MWWNFIFTELQMDTGTIKNGEDLINHFQKYLIVYFWFTNQQRAKSWCGNVQWTDGSRWTRVEEDPGPILDPMICIFCPSKSYRKQKIKLNVSHLHFTTTTTWTRVSLDPGPKFRKKITCPKMWKQKKFSFSSELERLVMVVNHWNIDIDDSFPKSLWSGYVKKIDNTNPS